MWYSTRKHDKKVDDVSEKVTYAIAHPVSIADVSQDIGEAYE